MLNDLILKDAVELELAKHHEHDFHDQRHGKDEDAAFDRALHHRTPFEALAGAYHVRHHADEAPDLKTAAE